LIRAIASINAALGAVSDAVLGPLAGLPPLASLAIVSLITAVVMLLVVRRLEQKALEQVKADHAALFEIRLFNDDLRAIFRAQSDMLRHNLTYLRLSIAPMLWMIVPFVFVIAQLQFQYGYDGLEPGRPVLLTAHLRAADQNGANGARLEAPEGIRADTDAVWFPGAQDLMWRITPQAAGSAAPPEHWRTNLHQDPSYRRAWPGGRRPARAGLVNVLYPP
jgi:hypothetical protein